MDHARPEPLRPVDVAVALALSGHHRDTYAVLSKRLGLSPSVVHGSVGRLRDAGLILPGSREPNRTALLAFLEHGVRYAFPAALGGVARGIPTAHAGPDLAEVISGEPVVWPSGAGSAMGPSVAPLHPRPDHLPDSAPGVYASLALVDALRVGRARERALAREALARRFEAERAGAA
jgi:DNA-binding Lrp family transcriptional regulator